MYSRGFATLLGLLLALVIIFILYYVLLNTYFKQPSLDKKEAKILSEQGIDSSTNQGVLDNTKKKVQDIERQIMNRERQLEDY